ncbi:copper transporter [Dermabacteraceae bacterium P13115]
MIDFRYHIVSLISVFVALAVGIVLGAGALRGNLGEQLTTQVEHLRTEKDGLRQKLEEQQGQVRALEDFGRALVPSLLDGRLTGHRVALVALDENNPAALDGLGTDVTAAGASEVVRVRITGKLTDEGADLSQVLGKLRAVLPGYTPSATSDSAQVSEYLLLALSGRGGTDSALPPMSQTKRQEILELISGDSLAVIDGDAQTPLDSLIIVSTSAFKDAELAQQREREKTVGLSLAKLANQLAVPTVVAGPEVDTQTQLSLLASLRGDGSLRHVSTVDGILRQDGQIVTVMALVATIEGRADAFGAARTARLRLPDLTAQQLVQETPVG